MFCMVNHTLKKECSGGYRSIEGIEDDFKISIVDTQDLVVEEFSRSSLEQALRKDIVYNQNRSLPRISGLIWNGEGKLVNIYDSTNNNHWVIDKDKKYAVHYEQFTLNGNYIRIDLYKSGVDYVIFGKESTQVNDTYNFVLNNLRVKETSNGDIVTIGAVLKGKNNTYSLKDIVFTVLNDNVQVENFPMGHELNNLGFGKLVVQ